MIHALAASLMASLLVACLLRASKPKMLLSFLGEQYEAWQITKSPKLPNKPTGGCCFCTSFWLPGIPVAIAVAWFTPAGWWAISVPFLIATLTDHFSQ